MGHLQRVPCGYHHSLTPVSLLQKRILQAVSMPILVFHARYACSTEVPERRYALELWINDDVEGLATPKLIPDQRCPTDTPSISFECVSATWLDYFIGYPSSTLC